MEIFGATSAMFSVPLSWNRVKVSENLDATMVVNFVYSEKATKFCEISTLLRSTVYHSDLECTITFVNSKMVKFQIFKFFSLGSSLHPIF